MGGPDGPTVGSNYGRGLAIVAPGVDIYSTYVDGDYANMTGTSMAVPHAAAAAALVWAAYPDLENWQVEQRLVYSNRTLDLDPSGWDEETGYGLVNSYRPSMIPEGDVNGDHKVNILDITPLAVSYGSNSTDSRWKPIADINIDRTINILDVVIIAAHFGEQY